MPVRRNIDPVSRDYVLHLGGYVGDVGLTSKVISRVATRRGSIVMLPTYGSRLHTIKGPVSGFEVLTESYVHEALDDLVQAREVNDLRVTVQRNKSALDISIDYRDRRGRRQTVPYTHRMTGA